MEFRFIDNSAPLDGQSRRLIRSHAMMGKNLGRIIPARGRKKRQCQEVIRMPSPYNPFAGAEFSYFALPTPLTPAMRYLFYQLFHCGLAMTGAHVSVFRGHPDEALEVTRHLSQALRLLRRDLNTAAVPQDPSVAVVISLVIYANLSGAVRESCIHLDGLQRILELRPGGLEALRVRNRELMNKIRRADMELALLAGTPTRFGPQHAPATLRVVSSLSNEPLPYPLSQSCAALQHTTLDIMALCHYARDAVQLDPYHYQDIIISISQRLVDFAPLSGARPSHQLDDMCQLGLLAFMTTVLYRTGRMRSIYSRLLSELLRARLDDYDEGNGLARAERYPLLRLWLVFFYAFSASEGGQWCDTGSFAAGHVRALAAALDLKTWKEVREHLSHFPWIAAWHDSPGKELWDLAHPRFGIEFATTEE
ncbi:hypothetical protein N7474_010091 [Penicillium riverlandense]|uniref:uncharacterized protein n=1 Tax=Penicillium riverlandense TaxID=1903569 RepID=UPI002549AB09|nr:uncharacterized protein N7474_010091 [Penicillium riverlandense]KAJ5808822.1 hypothetical protein N7474_010091 [Penicillium riverlandense]